MQAVLLWCALSVTTLLGQGAVAEHDATQKTRRTSPVSITGLYSDMHYNPETGDIGGAEILIVGSLRGDELHYFAFVQFASGKPDDPVLVKVRVTDDSNLEFTIPDTQLGTFRGRVNARELVGTFLGNDTRVRLPRGKSYWQQRP